jgi:hypothetical protein
MKELMHYFREIKSVLFLVLVVGMFFSPFVWHGKIPIPADTLLGMYHPWRDVTWGTYVSGVPYKNFLITDPIRQQYVWRLLSVDDLKNGILPVWNPYQLAGSPLAGNIQSAPYYPLNFIFILLPFSTAWGALVFLQPLLAGLFFYFYLKNRNISGTGSLIGAAAFSFSGFAVSWMEWNTIVHTLLWLPLILLSIDKVSELLSKRNPKLMKQISNQESFNTKHCVIWLFIFTGSLICSFLAGHLQVFFYSFLVAVSYTVGRIMTQQKRKVWSLLLFVFCYLLFISITFPVWLPILRFILLSARDVDQGSFLKPGWFIPWQHLMQFVAPDFFGNPATGNYFGVWNYAEFVGYVGIVPMILSLYALLFCRSRRILLWGSAFFAALFMALPTPLAMAPFILKMPLISTSQPTRLLSVITFFLALLSAVGFDYMKKEKNGKRVLIASVLPLCFLCAGWFVSLFGRNAGVPISSIEMAVAGKNLILPSIIFILSVFLLIISHRVKPRFSSFLNIGIVLFVIFDLYRFFTKFTPFTQSSWIFPQTKILQYLKEQSGTYRIMALDRRILPPNVSSLYRLHDVSGYDPLYLNRTGQLVAAWERGKSDITPASFNRILTPMNVDSFITDLFGVKYILSIDEIKNPKVHEVMREGETKLYENTKTFPRVFFVSEVKRVQTAEEEIHELFALQQSLRTIAVTTDALPSKSYTTIPTDSVTVKNGENTVIFETNTSSEQFVVFTDVYYPVWYATIDGQITKIHRVDFDFRGIEVPAGKHTIRMEAKLW